MFPIICIASFAGALVGALLIVLSYFKDKSLVVPYIIFGAFIAIFAVSVFFTLRSDDATADGSPKGSPQPVVSDALRDEPSKPNDMDTPNSPEPSEDPAPAESLNTGLLSIGDNATLGNWEISVTDFYYTDKIETSRYTYFYPDEGNKYAVVNVKVTNNGTEMDTFLPPINVGNDVWANLYFADKYEYSPSFLPGFDKDLSVQTINPLITKDGVIAFIVPDIVVNSTDPLSITFSIGRDEVSFSLR